MYDLFLISEDNNEWKNFKEIFPHAKRAEPQENVIFDCAKQSFTSMFWLVDFDVSLDPLWDFSFIPEQYDQQYIHTWQLHNITIDKPVNTYPVKLIPTQLILEKQKDIDELFESGGHIKPMPEKICYKQSFDLFFVWNQDQVDTELWEKILERFPNAQHVRGSKYLYIDIANKSTTEMFWVVEPGYVIDSNWDFTSTIPIWDRSWIHTWPGFDPVTNQENGEYPIKLVPKKLIRKNLDYIQYLFESIGHVKPMTEQIATKELHDLFFIWDNADLIENDPVWLSITNRFPHAQRIKGTESVYADIASISKTDMFYVVEPGYEINQGWDFKYTAPIWDRNYIHTWAGFDPLTHEPTEIYPIKLAPKNLILTTELSVDELFESIGHVKPMTGQIATKELHDLFFIWEDGEFDANHTLWQSIKTRFPHAKSILGTQTIYQEIAHLSTTDMFYAVEPEFSFDVSWDFKYTAPIWDRNYIHTWQAYSQDNHGVGTYPIKLIPKNLLLYYNGKVDDLFENPGYIKPMSDRVVYTEKFDIFFVSFNEPNADENWQRLLNRFPHAQRVHGIVGIDNAHRACAKLASTNMFWTVDADTLVDDTFNFDYIPSLHDRNYIHIWYSRNPVNGLEYGYGAVKLWPKSQVQAYEGSWLDYTVSVGQIKLHPDTVATTAFNSSPFETWKSAFRECVKLMRNIDENPHDLESKARLQTWIDVTSDAEYSHYCNKGASDAIAWYSENKNSLHLINKFSWLEQTYENLNKIMMKKVG